MRSDTGAKGAARRASSDVTTMRIRRTTLAKLAQRQKELGSSSLDDALETILFRQRAYEAIARLKSSPEQLADYQREAHEWAELDVEVHE